jgi:L-lactate dehydrogenase
MGAGDIGGAASQALAASGVVKRVVIVDTAESAAAGKALDIQQSLAIAGVDTRLQGTSDLTRAAGCAVCVVADQFGREAREWSGAEGLQMLGTLRPILVRAPVVFAGAAQHGLLLEAAVHGGYAVHRLIGSSAEALAGAVRSMVAVEARCAPAEVSASILGAPPSLTVAWSEASIAGHALERVLTPPQLARLDARARALWPPQALALGAAAATVAGAVIRSARRACSVLTVLDGEYGVRGVVGALPALLSTSGIVHRRAPALSPRERVQLETALGAPSR